MAIHPNIIAWRIPMDRGVSSNVVSMKGRQPLETQKTGNIYYQSTPVCTSDGSPLPTEYKQSIPKLGTKPLLVFYLHFQPLIHTHDPSALTTSDTLFPNYHFHALLLLLK